MRGDWRDWWISIQSPLCSYWDQLLLPKVTCSDNGGFQFLPGRGQERVGRPVGVLILFVCVRVVCLQAGYLLGWLQGLLLCPGQGLDGVGELLVDDHVGGVSDGGVLTPGLLSLLSRRRDGGGEVAGQQVREGGSPSVPPECCPSLTAPISSFSSPIS